MAFDYVPGAGDDEESWAKGLTPEIFWQNKEVLFSRLLHLDPSSSLEALPFARPLCIFLMDLKGMSSKTSMCVHSKTWTDLQLLLGAGPDGVKDVLRTLLSYSDEKVSERLSCPTALPTASQMPSKRGKHSLSVAVIRNSISGMSWQMVLAFICY